MGGVNASPNYVTEVDIGIADGTVTNTTKQGGIVSVYYLDASSDVSLAVGQPIASAASTDFSSPPSLPASVALFKPLHRAPTLSSLPA